VPGTTEIALDAADVEQGVDVVEPRPGLGLLVSHGVHHPVLFPAQPVHRVIPEVATKETIRTWTSNIGSIKKKPILLTAISQESRKS